MATVQRWRYRLLELKEKRGPSLLYVEAIAKLANDVTGLKGTVGSITIAPIKALGMLNLTSAKLTMQGLTTVDEQYGDRAAMLAIREDGEHNGQRFQYIRCSQREVGGLVLARPKFVGGTLVYEAPDMDPLLVTPKMLQPKEGPRVWLKMFKDGGMYLMTPENGPLSRWCRTLVAKQGGKPKVRPKDIEVLLPSDGFSRPVEDRHRCGQNEEVKTFLTDGGQMLVASSSTLAWMNEDLRRREGDGFREIEMGAFRPNIVLEGLPSCAEDLIERIAVGGVQPKHLSFGGLSVRCDVTRVVQDTGEKPDKEPLRWLLLHRPARPDSPNSVTFAVNVIGEPASAGMQIHCGEEFQVLSEKQYV